MTTTGASPILSSPCCALGSTEKLSIPIVVLNSDLEFFITSMFSKFIFFCQLVVF